MAEKNIPDNPATPRVQLPDRLLLRISVLRLPRDFAPSFLPIPSSRLSFQLFYIPFESIRRNVRKVGDGRLMMGIGQGMCVYKSERALSVKLSKEALPGHPFFSASIWVRLLGVRPNVSESYKAMINHVQSAVAFPYRSIFSSST
jgi:hypothetical protein